MLHNFTQLCEVVIVVDPQEQLGQVRRTLVIVLEVWEQLEYLIRLSLEVDLKFPELLFERGILHLLLIDAAEKSAKLSAHVQYWL